MKKNTSIFYYERIANVMEIVGVCIVLLLAFLMQFVFKELPCPLCLLQRFGFLAIAFGLLLNLLFGFRPSHYSITLLSAIFTGFVAMRQIALHVIPGTGAYGSAILGLHLYTWSLIIAVLIIISISILLGVDRQYLEKAHKKKAWEYIVHALFAVMVFLTVANIVSIIFECGFKQCPDNPTHYILYYR
jgi:disulfide bond formation protein DsbB